LTARRARLLYKVNVRHRDSVIVSSNPSDAVSAADSAPVEGLGWGAQAWRPEKGFTADLDVRCVLGSDRNGTGNALLDEKIAHTPRVEKMITESIQLSIAAAAKVWIGLQAMN
jgi:hypothetical protein